MKINKTIFLIASCSILVSCGGGNSMFGLKKSLPDEFKVISNPPLNMPPDFNLRPPASKYESNKTSNDDVRAYNNLSSSERALLNKANTSLAEPDIRKIIDDEDAQAQKEVKEKGLFDKVLSYTRGSEASKDPIIDANKEKQRLEENMKESQ